jgi:hypothetical protein
VSFQVIRHAKDGALLWKTHVLDDIQGYRSNVDLALGGLGFDVIACICLARRRFAFAHHQTGDRPCNKARNHRKPQKQRMKDYFIQGTHGKGRLFEHHHQEQEQSISRLQQLHHPLMSLSKLKSVYGIAGALGAVAAAAGGVAWYLLRDKRAKYVGKEAKATVKPEYTKEHVLECSAGARLAPAEDTKRHMLHYDSQWNSSEIAFKIANGHFSKIVVPCGKLDSGRAQLYRDGKPEYREIKGQDGNPLLKPVMVWHPTLVAQYKRLMRRRFQQIIRVSC